MSDVDRGAAPHDDSVPPVHPLSIQAASLIRSIDALSFMFWLSIGGTILTVLFAGLNQLPHLMGLLPHLLKHIHFSSDVGLLLRENARGGTGFPREKQHQHADYEERNE